MRFKMSVYEREEEREMRDIQVKRGRRETAP